MKAKLFIAATFSAALLILGSVAESQAVEPGDIYLYDTRTSSSSCLSCLVDPNGKFDDDLPKINSEKALWTQTRDTGTLNFVYDIAQGTCSEASEGFVWGTSPQKEGDFIVSTAHDRHDREIFLEDTARGTRRQLTENAVEDTAPCISGTAIAWVYGTGSNAEIVLLTDETEYEHFLADGFDEPEPSDFSSSLVTQNAYEDTFPHMKDDFLVWQGKVDGDWEIFVYNAASAQAPRQITNNDYNDISPKTDGDYVVWLAYNNQGGEIFAHNLSAGTTFQITDDTLIDNPPNIADGRVVWTSFDIVASVSVAPDDGNTEDGSDAGSGGDSGDNGSDIDGGGGGGGGACFVATIFGK